MQSMGPCRTTQLHTASSWPVIQPVPRVSQPLRPRHACGHAVTVDAAPHLDSAASSQGVDFKYTLIALKNTGRSRRATTRVGRRRKVNTHGYRAFESLEGCALPLMMLGQVEGAAGMHPSEAMDQATPLPPMQHHSAEQQPGSQPRRTHRRVTDSHAAASSVTAAMHPAMQASPAPVSTVVLLPPQQPTSQPRPQQQPMHTPGVHLAWSDTGLPQPQLGAASMQAGGQAAAPHPVQPARAKTEWTVPVALSQPQAVQGRVSPSPQRHNAGPMSRARRTTSGGPLQPPGHHEHAPSSQGAASSTGSMARCPVLPSPVGHSSGAVSAGSSSQAAGGPEPGNDADTSREAAGSPQQQHLAACAVALGLHPRKMAVHFDLTTTFLRVEDPQVLKKHVRGLCHLLKAPREAVRAMALQHPMLLLTPLSLVTQRAQQVSALLWGQDAKLLAARRVLLDAPQLLTMHHTPAEAMLGLARALHGVADMKIVVKLVTAHPAILAHSHAPAGSPYTSVLQCLTEQLQCDAARAVRACVLPVPALLLQSPAAVQGCCTALCTQWSLEKEQLLQMAEAQPQLLLWAPETAKIMSQRLWQLLAKSRRWRVDIPKLKAKPRALARALTFNTARLDRLQYLLFTRRDTGIDWRDALTMQDPDWHDMYPQYTDWWGRRGRKMRAKH